MSLPIISSWWRNKSSRQFRYIQNHPFHPLLSNAVEDRQEVKALIICASLVKISLNAPVSYTIDFEFEPETGTVDNHLERKV